MVIDAQYLPTLSQEEDDREPHFGVYKGHGSAWNVVDDGNGHTICRCRTMYEAQYIADALNFCEDAE